MESGSLNFVVVDGTLNIQKVMGLTPFRDYCTPQSLRRSGSVLQGEQRSKSNLNNGTQQEWQQISLLGRLNYS